MTSEETSSRWESEINAKTSGLVFNFLKKIPSIWKAKRKAKKFLKFLPEYDRQLTLPSSEEIFSWIKEICKTPHRRVGTPEGHAAEK